MIPIREDFAIFFDIPPRLPNGAAAHFGLRSASGATSLCDQRQPGRQSQRPILATSGRTPSGPNRPFPVTIGKRCGGTSAAIGLRSGVEIHSNFIIVFAVAAMERLAAPPPDGCWSSCFGMPCFLERKVSRCFINPTTSIRTRRSAWRRTNFNGGPSLRVAPRRFLRLPFKQRGARASFRASSMHFMQVDACRQPC